MRDQEIGNRTLAVERTARRNLSAGEAHTYDVAMRAGEYLEVTVEQLGIDTAARVLDATGSLIREFDSPTGASGLERIRVIADTNAAYRLEIRALQPEADSGAYEIRLAVKRMATDADRRIEAAVKAEAEANHLRVSAETRTESLNRYKQARALWQSAGDRAGEASTLRGMGFAYVRLKDDAKALEVFTEAQRRFRELRELRSEAYIYLIVANIETRRGDLRQALVTTGQSLPLWRSAKDREQEAFTLAALGTLHARLGDAARMKRWHRDAVRVARSTRRPALAAAMFQSEGGAAEILGDRKYALAAYQSALQLWREAGNNRGEAAARTRIAELEKTAASSGPAG
ncbi:MAG: tetratricopeptide repeat protein [Acidobacteria bacterium]|nr:tetratricopeptide repeat protein [Acidobacteriota bacterium]